MAKRALYLLAVALLLALAAATDGGKAAASRGTAARPGPTALALLQGR